MTAEIAAANLLNTHYIIFIFKCQKEILAVGYNMLVFPEKNPIDYNFITSFVGFARKVS